MKGKPKEWVKKVVKNEHNGNRYIVDWVCFFNVGYKPIEDENYHASSYMHYAKFKKNFIIDRSYKSNVKECPHRSKGICRLKSGDNWNGCYRITDWEGCRTKELVK